ncbi:DUF4232 domain-containing protein [Streptacidiphilus melanogenes]|uniref:DUF4232 domain-containing protein n=1 Tax=Streptacidiphilus melanogenes TaxID=411235 RepID=UPI000A02811D|nr:DUF4232 domain-containing protein [Streptacidiphilus melanogenes]
MKPQMKKAAAAAAAATACATLLVGAGSGSAFAQGAHAPAGCSTADLKVALHPDDNQAGVGNFGEDLVFTNASRQTCTVYGYPGLGLLGSTHGALPIKVVWGSTYFVHDPGRHTVTLRPGQSAWADLAWNAPYGVKSVKPAYLEVTPPNQWTHVTLRFAPGAIDDSALHVTALAAGSAPRV